MESKAMLCMRVEEIEILIILTVSILLSLEFKARKTKNSEITFPEWKMRRVYVLVKTHFKAREDVKEIIEAKKTRAPESDMP